jgi:hypothetical protein
MEVARNGLSAPRWAVVALVALLGMAVMAGGSASASGSSHAVVAKKCKKKKRSASSAKKKKCKRKKVVLPLPGPIVRGTLTWSGGTSGPSGTEVDLHAFDASGNHTGWVDSTSGVVNGIPNAVHSGDVGGASGTESFTDNIFVVGGPANREFSYVACVYSPNPSSATFTGVARTGQTSSVPVGPGGTALTVPGGPAIPASFSCP